MKRLLIIESCWDCSSLDIKHKSCAKTGDHIRGLGQMAFFKYFPTTCPLPIALEDVKERVPSELFLRTKQEKLYCY
jgi:hypothetical protein